MTAPASARIAFETARLSLARQVIVGDATLDQAFDHAASVSAKALHVARVGIWLFEDNEQRLACRCLYRADTQAITRGDVLAVRSFPTYFSALHERRAFAVLDAQAHALTRELTEAYLSVHNIVSSLHAPIIVDGRVIGVVCCEHVGAQRQFEQRDLDFAGSVADTIALFETQAQRVRLEVALREQEELMQRAAKLEALARLSGTAAHDFNNVLGVMMVTAELLNLHTDPNVRDSAQSILEAVKMGARISNELLVVGRKAPSQPVGLRLDQSIEGLAQVLRTRFGARLDVVTETTLKDVSVLADPAQIERIVLNLGVNAGEAIEQHGRILLRVRAPLPEEVSARGWVVIEVSDDGVGMSHEVRSHLFEPYFTTKASGHGLGLASVYGIVRQLNGKVLVESEPGHGTTFVIILPTVV